MAALNPPAWLQSASHPADVFRRTTEALLGGTTGVRGSTDLAVTANGTPNMSVNVAAGEAFLPGTESSLAQGAYHVVNDAVVNLVIAAADATNPRRDLVVAKVQDSAYSGATNAWSLAVVTGTPAASPADPAAPANSITLARVAVAANATTVVTGNITDLRPRAAGLGGVAVVTSGTRPAGPTKGMAIFETDTGRMLIYDGTNWNQLRIGGEPPNTGQASLANGNATVLTAFYGPITGPTLPYPYKMIVTAHGQAGFAGANNQVNLRVIDEGSANISTVGAGQNTFDLTAGKYSGVATAGTKNYAAGAASGFSIQYSVSASNVYLELFVTARFEPR